MDKISTKDILINIIKCHSERLIGGIDSIESYDDREDAKSLSIHVKFKKPIIYTTRDTYTIEL